MISLVDLTMQFGAQTLFEDVNLQLRTGERYGIVGANGSGKSTLLKLLSGELTASGGEINVPNRARLGVLEQDHFQYEDVRILDVVMMGNETLWEAMVEKEKIFAEAHVHFDEERYVELEDIVQRFDGYGLESRAAEILEGLGIPQAQHDQPLSVLSGGYKLRALMAKVLASEPDVLLLDEPTNHLDILAVRWLEQFLERFKGCVVVVSHDIRFLDAVCTVILDVDYERVMSYPGNFSRFMLLKADERERMERERQKREDEIEQHKAFIRRFKAKATKARQANSRQKRMEKIELVSLPTSSRRSPRFVFEARRRSGRHVLKVQGVSKAFGEKVVLEDVSFDVERGDRVAIIGPNGVGKSTLLKILVGELEADSGSSEWGYEADFGYFPQDHAGHLGGPEHTVKTSLWDACPQADMGEVLGRLAAVLFSRDEVDKTVDLLSGGEAARLLFSRIAVTKPTVMVLDEPTNHLDIEAIRALAAALRKYPGTLLFVSHDRWFVEKLATRIIEIRPGGLSDFTGDYKRFMASGAQDHLDAAGSARRRKKARRRR